MTNIIASGLASLNSDIGALPSTIPSQASVLQSALPTALKSVLPSLPALPALPNINSALGSLPSAASSELASLPSALSSITSDLPPLPGNLSSLPSALQAELRTELDSIVEMVTNKSLTAVLGLGKSSPHA